MSTDRPLTVVYPNGATGEIHPARAAQAWTDNTLRDVTPDLIPPLDFARTLAHYAETPVAYWRTGAGSWALNGLRLIP